MAKMILVSIFLTLSLQFVLCQFDGTCRTINGYTIPGSCIKVRECKPYVALLLQNAKDPFVIQRVKKSVCGYEHQHPKVCCPLQSFQTVEPATTTTTTPAPAPSAQTAFYNIVNGVTATFDGTCRTLNGYTVPGSCIKVRECKPYVALLLQNAKDPVVMQRVKKATCGVEGQDPKVCCPLQSFQTVEPATTTTTTPAPAPSAQTAFYNIVNGVTATFDGTCRTLNGYTVPGSCIKVRECKPYVALLLQNAKDPVVMQRVKKATCGVEGQDPKVCCPLQSFQTVEPATTTTTTPAPAPSAQTVFDNIVNGVNATFDRTCRTLNGYTIPGSCIKARECKPYVALLLQIAKDPVAMQRVTKATCGYEGPDPKVCCPLQNFAPVEPDTTTTTTTTTNPTTILIPESKVLNEALIDDDFVTALPEPPVCGVSNASNSRIVNGVNATLGDYPWMGVVGYHNESNRQWLCGCSIITVKHTLTAGHCISWREDTLKIVRVGELDFAREDDGATPIDVLVKRMILHQNYNPNLYANDIGILVLEKELVFTELIKPICLPKSRYLRSKSFETLNPTIAGWGKTDFNGLAATHLQVIDVPVKTKENCIKAYAVYDKMAKIDERVLCAGYDNGSKETCLGDSGGPLMLPIVSS
ncbi:hypothetical protein K1T71_012012 [Dendrolimus kikuchii]|uniref:Uncharacterized protein n=1 Tax=Dendrolimus kikuchii TaxID=765133 RepID=A0ACC1CKB7_9NEOP|nr:hypothetical protein K1T71_012012 [Dendrolimus kikuchii]